MRQRNRNVKSRSDPCIQCRSQCAGACPGENDAPALPGSLRFGTCCRVPRAGERPTLSSGGGFVWARARSSLCLVVSRSPWPGAVPLELLRLPHWPRAGPLGPLPDIQGLRVMHAGLAHPCGLAPQDGSPAGCRRPPRLPPARVALPGCQVAPGRPPLLLDPARGPPPAPDSGLCRVGTATPPSARRSDPRGPSQGAGEQQGEGPGVRSSGP